MNYDFSGWHPVCTNKGMAMAPDGLHVYCLDCGVSANVEAISGKINAMDSFVTAAEIMSEYAGKNPRTWLGKQSPGVVKQ